jgi:RNA polymerase sigma factor (TIGR02999 family)
MTGADPTHVRELLRRCSTRDDGARLAGAELLPAVYDELRALARARMAREPRGATIEATALVHEAWLRLAGDEDPGWNSRAHFFGAAAQAMRRILVERARERAAVKHGGGAQRVTLDDAAALCDAPSLEVLALDEALAKLEAHDARKAQVVTLKHFAGLEIAEIGAALDVSVATVKSDWAYARAWLHREMERV